VKRSYVFLVIALVLGLVGLGAFSFYKFAAPTVLRIAVGPIGSEDTKVVATVLQTFAREKHPIRLKLVPTDSLVASADLLKNEKVELAIVRSDANVPPNATTVAIMHRDTMMILAPAGRGIESIAELAGRRIGIGRGVGLNQRLLDLVLERNGIDPANVAKVPVRPTDVRTAMNAGVIDAMLFVGPPTGSQGASAYEALTDDQGRPPVILRVENAEAIVQRIPTLEVSTILRGTFGGAPPRPAENIETIAVTHRLMADRGLKDSVVADLAKALFAVRQSVAAEAPNFARIEAPDTEKLGPLVVHPGAAAYFEGEQKSFIEQYGEWIYISIMGFSLVGSLAAALLSRQFSSARPAGTTEIDRLLLLLRKARLAPDESVLDRLQQEADEVFGRTVERAAESSIDEAVMSAFTIALGEVRTAIDDRRRILAQEPPIAP